MTSTSQLDPRPSDIEYTVATVEQRTKSMRAQTRGARRLMTDVRKLSLLPQHQRPAAAAPAFGRQQKALTASAKRLTAKEATSRDGNVKGGAGKTAEWQEEAWDLRDLIGEQRFLDSTLSGRMSQAGLYVGKTVPMADPGDAPEKVDDATIQALLHAIGDGPAGLGQLVNRYASNMFVAGEAWLVGVPPRLVPDSPEQVAAKELLERQQRGEVAVVDREAVAEITGDPDVLKLDWRMMSVSELSTDTSGKVTLRLAEGTTVEAPAAELYMIRIWRPHPRRAWEADSPTRASLPVLRELLGLTMHVSAQIDSRLAGAGVLFIPTEIEAALKASAGMSPDDESSPLTDALIEAMVTPIKDRSSASAVVPLVVSGPGEHLDKIKHVPFSTALDKEARQLRDEAIRRLALGQDAPPELLLGVSGMNHWGAWLVREDVVKTHLEPPLALLCDALTTEYLRPVLMASRGMSEEEASQYVVWFDTDHLIERPDRRDDAKALYGMGAITDAALREANGFSENDAPDLPTVAQNDPAVDLALQLVGNAPSLMQAPGLPVIVEQIRAVMEGEKATAAAAAAAVAAENAPSVEVVEGESTEGSMPSTSPGDAAPGTPANPGGAA